MVVGRSDIVGKPMALLLLHEHATVTICHSRTPDLAAVCREADILVAAIGRAGMITAEYMKPGATVIDVGMNRITDARMADRIFRACARTPGCIRPQGQRAGRRCASAATWRAVARRIHARARAA